MNGTKAEIFEAKKQRYNERQKEKKEKRLQYPTWLELTKKYTIDVKGNSSTTFSLNNEMLLEELIDYIAYVHDIPTDYVGIHDINPQKIHDFIEYEKNPKNESHHIKRLKDDIFRLLDGTVIVFDRVSYFLNNKLRDLKKRTYNQLILEENSDNDEDRLYQQYKKERCMIQEKIHVLNGYKTELSQMKREYIDRFT